jgi:hypothetical protein
MKKFFVSLLLVFCLSSCTEGKTKGITALFQSDTNTPAVTLTASSTVTPLHTSTGTPSPLPSATSTPSATPMGGKPLRVAYLGFRCEEVNSKNCIIIADFFSGEEKYKIPLGDLTTEAYMSWSPDGRYLMYTDCWESYVNIMLLDVEQQQSIKVDTSLLRMPTKVVEDTGSTITYDVFAMDNNVIFSKWSQNGKYIAYKTTFSVEDQSVFVYSLEDNTNTKLNGYLYSFYWLNDGENLLEIKTGNLYNAGTKELSKIPYDYFMNVNSIYGDAIISVYGDEPYYPDKIIIIPYINDLLLLEEEGTGVLHENEIVVAQAYQDKKRKPYLALTSYFIQDDEIILSGFLRLSDPYFSEQFVKFGSMDDLPLLITQDDLSDESIILISPDHQFYLSIDAIWEVILLNENYTRSSLINCYDLNTRELLYTYDMHLLADDPHTVMYSNNKNIAFFWEE